MPLLLRFAPLLVAFTTFAAFLPVLHAQFLNWDDEANLVNNAAFRGLGLTNLAWMFTTNLMGHWIPLTWITLGVDYLVWGLNPFGYHLTSLLLHTAASVVFYFVALRLLRAAMNASGETALRLGAAASALFFAIHPLRVESVAWVTERRDMLSGLWFFLTVLLYLKAADGGAWRRIWLWTSVACYVLAIASKAIVMTLPLILVLLDVYPLRRLGSHWTEWAAPGARRLWAEKIPYVLIAVTGAGIAAYVQRSFAETLAIRPLPGRIAAAGYGLWFYLWKTVDPSALRPLYEIAPRVDPLALPMVASALAVVAITAALVALRHRWPAGLAVWISYVIILLPVSGLTQSGPQLVAARYSYLTCLGWALLLGAGVAVLPRRAGGGTLGLRWSQIGPLAAAVILTALGVLTWRDSLAWRDSGTLWAHAVSLDPSSSIAHNNLAVVLMSRRRFDEAEPHIRTALELRPEYIDARLNLATVLDLRGKADDAREARSRLGYTLIQHGKLKEATDLFQKEVDSRPGDATARNNLGVALYLRAYLAPAIEQFERALQIKPDFSEAKKNLDAARAARR